MMGSKKTGNTFKRKLLAAAIVSCFSSGNALAADMANASFDPSKVSMSASGSTLTITNTPNAIINWTKFGIAAGETVNFIQQSSKSAVLNRVTGSDPSNIFGALTSNGKVFLINPNGIMFGASARIDVNGLVASTLNLNDADFLAGKFNFNADRANPGSVVNAGKITTPSGGFVYLLAPNVENSGVITTPSGEAILAAGNSIEIVDSTDPSQRVLVSATSKDVNLSSLMTQSNGNIFTVLNSGKVSANTVVQDATGKIYFKSAGNVQTTSTSVVEAKGDINANGGRFIGFADGNGVYAGSFDASGENGGYVETSGHWIDVNDAHLNLRGLDPNGTGGEWLLDPVDVFITSSGTDNCYGSIICTNATSIILASTLNTVLNNATTVTIATNGGSGGNGDIFVNATITAAYGSGTTTLNLNADRDIVFGSGAGIQHTGAGTFNSNFTATRDVVFTGGNSIGNNVSAGTFNAAFNATQNINFSGTSNNLIYNNSTANLNVKLAAGAGVVNAAGSSLKLDGVGGVVNALLQSGGTWTNNGYILLTGNSSIDLFDTSVATFTNNGLVDIINNTSNWAFFSENTNDSGILNNNGTIFISGSSLTSFEALFNNSGTGNVVVQDGVLSLQNADTLSGDINIKSGATLWMSQAHTGARTFDGATIANDGTLTLSVATTFNNSTLSSSGNLSVPTTNATYTGSATFVAGGDLTLSGTMSGSADSIYMWANGNLNINSSSITAANFVSTLAANTLSISNSSVSAGTGGILMSAPTINLSNATLTDTGGPGMEIFGNSVSLINSSLSTSYTGGSYPGTFPGIEIIGASSLLINNTSISATSSLTGSGLYSGVGLVSQNLNIQNSSLISADMVGINDGADILFGSLTSNNFFDFNSTATVTVDSSDIDATYDLGFAGDHVTLKNGAAISAGRNMHGVAMGDLKLDGAELNAQTEMLLEVGGHLYLDNSASIEVNYPLTLYFNFPLLASDGWYVDGVANSFGSFGSGSWILVNGATPIEGVNFFVTYGGLQSILPILNLMDKGLIDPGTSALIDAQLAADIPSGDEVIGNDGEQKEEDKPQQCSA